MGGMSYADEIARTGRPVSISPSSTSYFSQPSSELDPKLFAGMHLRPWVRNGVLSLLMHHLMRNYTAPERWAVAWLAGSGVSYQWSADRVPGDLDCLVGIDYHRFRENNPEFVGLSDAEISAHFNEEFNNDLMPETSDWNGFELTFYVNSGATDIRAINPYAAYDLTHDRWTVEPDPRMHAPFSRAWDQKVERDLDQTHEIIRAYAKALTDVQATTNPAYRINAEARLQHAISSASSLYNEIHHGRKVAFSPAGAGYADFNNYRWQAGKKSGAIPALRKIKQYADAARDSSEAETYGIELPSTDVLVRRAATYRQ